MYIICTLYAERNGSTTKRTCEDRPFHVDVETSATQLHAGEPDRCDNWGNMEAICIRNTSERVSGSRNTASSRDTGDDV